MSPTKRVSARARAAAIPTRPQAGGSRKKTGCYTCRIRRKKCDETRDGPHGGCETCHRLRLECLGYGDKRPTWLRDRQFLEDTLEKIKKHLTKNGLLRGQHSARAATCLSNEGGTGAILILNPSIPTFADDEDDRGTTSDSSSSPTLSFHEDLYAISSARDEPCEPELVPNVPFIGESAIEPNLLPMGPSSTAMYYNNDMPSSTLVLSQFTPGYDSTFGTSYNIHEGWYSPEGEYPPETEYAPKVEYPRYDESQTFLWPSTSAQAQQPLFASSDYFFRPVEHDTLSEYFHWVAKKQFLLADQRVLTVIYNALLKSSPAHQAATLLTQLHQYTAQGLHAPPQLAQHVENWAATIMSTPAADQGSALAALQLISCLLHVGGRGPWQTYLDHAIDWVLSSINASPYPPATYVRRQPADAQFVIRTAMWFDVLGSITRAQPPRLLQVFRDLHHSAQVVGFVEDGGSGEREEEEPMVPIMGCENAIVRALGEISWLAHWRDEQRARGTLSTVDLVQRGLEIERDYLSPPSPTPTPLAATDPVGAQRMHTSAVFRASAKLYLHTILSGELPGCPEVRAAVTETIDALRNVPADGDAERSIVRMTVFAICLAGCMSDDPEQRTFLEERLERQQAEKVGGNCAEVLRVMRDVWEARARGEPIGWREAVAKSPQGMLLLV